MPCLVVDFIVYIVSRDQRNGAVIARCSQPEVGWLGWRSTEDEGLISAILAACSLSDGDGGSKPKANGDAGT